LASRGAGSQPHLAAELLFRDAGVKGLSVPFRGDVMAHTELLAGSSHAQRDQHGAGAIFNLASAIVLALSICSAHTQETHKKHDTGATSRPG
jgi:tripartite-type tricarboxylate transporter receptor subunit TctC